MSVGRDDGHVSAAELPKESVLPLASAMKAAHATVNRCFADGYQVSVTMVDKESQVEQHWFNRDITKEFSIMVEQISLVIRKSKALVT